MKIIICLCILMATGSSKSFSQSKPQYDSTINNLVFPAGYVTHEEGAPPSFASAGKGSTTLILIPGLGFDASAFDDFVTANRNRYKMYSITLPGLGSTPAPVMPPVSVSYGEQSWNRYACAAIESLIKREKINRPILVGHFITGTQIAIRMALDYPDLIGGVIILGGAGKMMAHLQGKLVEQPVKDMIKATDRYWGPQWFKHMTEKSYDDGNFTADVYSANPAIASNLWKQVTSVAMPVAVRYSCEYFASDVIAEIDKIKCPMLVLRARFTDSFWENQMNKSWIEPQFIESWNLAQRKNPAIKIFDIKNSGAFVWKDNPSEVYYAIDQFLRSR